ncbi:MAG: DUF4418 family protein [Synergistaceae bacterium]|nr:DUF4418 family protein [Synergistaceae bacterium]
MRIQKILSALSFISGAILAMASFILFPVCENLKQDGTRMGCFYSGIFITAMGILILIFSLLCFFKKFPAAMNFLSSVSAVMSWLVPNRIINLSGENWFCGLCGSLEHACRASTMPAVGVLIAVIVLVNFAGLIFNFINGNK